MMKLLLHNAGIPPERSRCYCCWWYLPPAPLPVNSNVVGGAAGCVVASRLAEADPALQVLIIESGKNNLNDSLVRTPAYCVHHLKPNSDTAQFHVSNPSTHVAGRSIIVPSGNILGGGSSINFMMYTRASASDYDDWNTEGWTFEDLKPLLLKACLRIGPM